MVSTLIQDARSAVDLNNSGVACFRAGDRSSAVRLFKLAVSSLIGSLNVEDYEANPSSDTDHDENNGSLDLFRSLSAELQVPLQTDQHSFPEPSVSDYIYVNPMNLMSSKNAYASDSLVDVTVQSAMVLFNIGLVYHLVGQDDICSCDESNIVKAKKLYERATSLLCNCSSSAYASSGRPVVDILSMAILNNLGAAAHQLNLYEESEHYLRGLNILASSLRIPDANEEMKDILRYYQSYFLFNSVSLQPPTRAPAA